MATKIPPCERCAGVNTFDSVLRGDMFTVGLVVPKSRWLQGDKIDVHARACLDCGHIELVLASPNTARSRVKKRA